MIIKENIDKAKGLIIKGEWVPINLTPPLNEGLYLVTLKEYDHPFIARFYPNNEPALVHDGGYWIDNIYTLNDYGILAWKPAPERYREPVETE